MPTVYDPVTRAFQQRDTREAQPWPPRRVEADIAEVESVEAQVAAPPVAEPRQRRRSGRRRRRYQQILIFTLLSVFCCSFIGLIVGVWSHWRQDPASSRWQVVPGKANMSRRQSAR